MISSTSFTLMSCTNSITCASNLINRMDFLAIVVEWTNGMRPGVKIDWDGDAITEQEICSCKKFNC